MTVLVLSQPHARQWFPSVTHLLKDYISFGAKNPLHKVTTTSQTITSVDRYHVKCFIVYQPLPETLQVKFESVVTDH